MIGKSKLTSDAKVVPLVTVNNTKKGNVASNQYQFNVGNSKSISQRHL